MHKCDQCGETFELRPDLEAHCILTHNCDLLDCDRCDFRTTNLSSLEQHRHERHSHEGPVTPYTPIVSKHANPVPREIRCRECGCEFVDHSSLQTHFLVLHKSEHIVPKMPYGCCICQFACATQQTMMEHMRIHTGQVLQCRAEDCQFRTPYDSVLKEHVTYVHNDDFIIRCPHCGHSVGSLQTFERHFSCHHPKMCHSCIAVLRKHFPNRGSSAENGGSGGSPAANGLGGLSLYDSAGDLHVVQVKRSRKQSKPRKLIKGRLEKRRRGKQGWRGSGRDDSDPGDVGKFRCRLCHPSKPFYVRKNMLVHVLWQHGRKAYPCEHCNTYFRHQYQVLLHASRAHVVQRETL